MTIYSKVTFCSIVVFYVAIVVSGFVTDHVNVTALVHWAIISGVWLIVVSMVGGISNTDDVAPKQGFGIMVTVSIAASLVVNACYGWSGKGCMYAFEIMASSAWALACWLVESRKKREDQQLELMDHTDTGSR